MVMVDSVLFPPLIWNVEEQESETITEARCSLLSELMIFWL